MTRLSIRSDLEMMLVVLFWAFNVTVVKWCLADMAPLAFNIIRFGLAAVALMALTLWWDGFPRLTGADMRRMVVLGLLGHALYQVLFVVGLARTTASSTALLFGSTPIVVAIMTRLAGHERVGWGGVAGALLAFGGVFLIVRGGGAAASASPAAGSSLAGNLLIMAAVICWSAYTVLSRDLLTRHSPLRVTAVTLTIGALLLLPLSVPSLARQDWTAVRAITWMGLLYSFVFALVISYILWYRSVRSVGNVRTSLYSNLVPVFGALFGVAILGERLNTGVGMGAACILGGIALSRWRDARERRAAAWSVEPVEGA